VRIAERPIVSAQGQTQKHGIYRQRYRSVCPFGNGGAMMFLGAALIGGGIIVFSLGVAIWLALVLEDE
jgi:hypothetical protein